MSASMLRRPLRALAVVPVAALAGCSDAGAALLRPPTLEVRPDTLVVSTAQRVALEATLQGAPAGRAVRWRTQDTTVFRMDTTTTGAHRALGQGGRCSGSTYITVTSGDAFTTVYVIVLRGTVGGCDAS
jgi:hypothetical protein